MVDQSSKPGVGKLQPAGQLRPLKRACFLFKWIAAREHVNVALKHVNLTRKTKLYSKSTFSKKKVISTNFFLSSWISFKNHLLSSMLKLKYVKKDR